MRAVTDERLRGWLLVGGQFVLLGVLVAAPAGTLWSLPDQLRAAGTLGRAVGAAAIVVGAEWLGRAASVHPAPSPSALLRVSGPYRYVRHPIYTGVLVLAGAMVLTGRSVLHLVAFATLVVVLIAKARFEEALLAERFPDYPAYARRTRRFLPLPRRRRPRAAMTEPGGPTGRSRLGGR